MKYLLILLLCTGCSWTAYNRETLPDGTETIKAGRISIASDLDLSDLLIESGDKKLAVDRAIEDQDEIDVTAIVGGIPINVKSSSGKSLTDKPK